jgi:hypothetical protein
MPLARLVEQSEERAIFTRNDNTGQSIRSCVRPNGRTFTDQFMGEDTAGGIDALGGFVNFWRLPRLVPSSAEVSPNGSAHLACHRLGDTAGAASPLGVSHLAPPKPLVD